MGSENAFGKLSKCKRRRNSLTSTYIAPLPVRGDLTGGYGRCI